MINYYKVLGVKNFAPIEEIKSAYRKLSKKLHPDVNDNDPFFTEKFKELQEAFECLNNNRNKARYDNHLRKYLNDQNAERPGYSSSADRTSTESSNSTGTGYTKPQSSTITLEKKKPVWSIVISLIIFVSMCFRIVSCYSSYNEAPNKEAVGEIMPVSEWSKTLIGKWSVETETENERDYWTIKSDIEFLPNQEFILNTTAKYYYIYEGRKSSEAHTVAGGNVSGKWNLLTDSSIKLMPQKCDISDSYVDYGYKDNTFEGCGYFNGIQYGAVKDNSISTNIKEFSQTKIYITGRDYRQDRTIKTTFTKKPN